MSIFVDAVERPSKEALAAAIAVHLGLDAPAVSRGGSVSSLFLDQVYGALFGGSSGGADTYRMAERLLSRLGLVYDPWWDTSEARRSGGGTVTTRTFSRLLSSITESPRCFIVKWSPTRQIDLVFPTRADLNPFAEAGPGSMVLLVDDVVGDLVGAYAWAEVTDMSPGWRTAPWFATLGPLNKLIGTIGVSVNGLQSGPLRLTEIAWDSFRSVVLEGTVVGNPLPPPQDSGAHQIANRINRDYPAEFVPIGHIRVPDPDLTPPTTATIDHVDYRETEVDGRSVVSSADTLPADQLSTVDQIANKLAESRAITYAIRALNADGWTLERDCQQDGVGYDLLFKREERRLKVEVKGIQGPSLIFNVTPKEWWRAATDPDWVVFAVTSVLSPTAPHVHVLSRSDIHSARRLPLGYRLWVT